MEPAPDPLAIGLQHHQHGRLDHAEGIYLRVLEKDPNDGNALQLVGIVAHQQGKLERAQAYKAKALAAGVDEAVFHNNLGYALKSQDRLADAIASYRQALAIHPNYAEAHNNLGIALQLERRFDEARAAFREALRCKPEWADVYNNLGLICHKLGNLPEAAANYREVLRLRPGDPEAEYHLAVATGEATPPVAPPDLITAMFDDYAKTFDEHLVSHLKYRGPDMIREVLGPLLPDRPLDIVDLGCGTGLVGAVFKPLARRLVGVDLSGEMIVKARERGIYDELMHTDLIDALAECPAAYDVALAGDVFIYLGDLVPVFRALSKSLRPGGLLAFTVEHYTGAGYLLGDTGRFAHSEAYVTTLAKSVGLQEVGRKAAILRKEKEKDVDGFAYAFQRVE